jgi:hypothetical protein
LFACGKCIEPAALRLAARCAHAKTFRHFSFFCLRRNQHAQEETYVRRYFNTVDALFTQLFQAVQKGSELTERVYMVSLDTQFDRMALSAFQALANSFKITRNFI